MKSLLSMMRLRDDFQSVYDVYFHIKMTFEIQGKGEKNIPLSSSSNEWIHYFYHSDDVLDEPL